MPIDWTPRRTEFSAPKAGALRDALLSQIKAYGGSTQGYSSNFGEFFDEGQVANVEGGRAGVEANTLISEALQTPARALEAPLRPLNVATGGALGQIIQQSYQSVRAVPVAGTGLGAIEGVVDVLSASEKAGRSFVNSGLAQALRDSIGKNPNDTVTIGGFLGFGGKEVKVSDIREEVMKKWNVNQFTGEQFDLAMLEERAAKDPWNFGEFATSDNGIFDFFISSVADPMNLIMPLGFMGGKAALKGGARLGRIAAAQPWAQPAVSLGGRMAGAPRLGYGAYQALRGTEVGQAAVRGMDSIAAAKEVLAGNIRSHGTLSSILQATELGLRGANWGIKNTLVPGYGRFRQMGMGRAMAGATAYTRGGLQQLAIEGGTESLIGAISGRQYDEELGVITEGNGFLSDIQDALHNINNNHPLSDNQTFMVLALFSPWGKALSGTKAAATGASPEHYAERALSRTNNELAKLTGVKAYKYEEVIARLGKGDRARGIAAWEWFTDLAEALKDRNQWAAASNELLSMEAKVHRAEILSEGVRANILAKRASGAMRPESLGDFMIQLMKEGIGGDDAMRLARGSRTISRDGFYDFVANLYDANERLAPDLAEMGGLMMTQGAPVTQESLRGLRGLLDAYEPDELVRRDAVSKIMESNPELIFEGEWWRGLGNTLGQNLRHTGIIIKRGKGARAALETENITVRELREKFDELIDTAPSERELFHEAFQVEKSAAKAKPGDLIKSVNSAMSYPTRLKRWRDRFVGVGTQHVKHRDALKNIKADEFYRNGKAKFKVADTLTGKFGRAWDRITGNTFRREASERERMLGGTEMSLTIEDNIIEIGGVSPEHAPYEPMDSNMSRNIEDSFAEDLASHVLSGQRGTPDAIELLEDNLGAPWVAGGPRGTRYSRVIVYHYNDVGVPDAWAGGMRVNDTGEMISVDIYVAPEARGPRETGRVADRLYDEFFKQGYDIAPVSGINNTEAGRAFTNRYWANRRDTLDTEAIDLAVRNDGRVIVRPVLGDQSPHQFEGRRRPRVSIDNKAVDGPTLSRWGFEEVARYRGRSNVKVEKVAGDQIDLLLDPDPDVLALGNRVPVTEPMRIKEGYIYTTSEGFRFNVFKPAERVDYYDPKYFYVEPADYATRDVWEFSTDVMEFRSRKLADELIAGPEQDFAVFAYRGGDPTKAALNSRNPGITQEYKPSSRTTKTREGAISLARQRAAQSSELYPAVDSLGPSRTRADKYMSARERRHLLDEMIAEQDKAIKSAEESIQKIDDAAMRAAGLEKVTQVSDWFNSASADEINKLVDVVKYANREFPDMQVTETRGIFIDPRADRFSHLAVNRSLWRRMAFDYGFLSGPSHFYNALFAPYSTHWLQKQTYQEVHSLLAPLGWSVDDVDAWLKEMKHRVDASRSETGLGNVVGTHWARNIRALREGDIRQAAMDTVGKAKTDALIGRFGTGQRLITEAGNRLLRRSAQRARHGGKVGKLEAAVNGAFRLWEGGPGIQHVSAATHMVSKTFYPIFRFAIDPAFMFMNVTEPYMYGLSIEGRRALRAHQSAHKAEISARAAHQASLTSIPPGGFADTAALPVEALLTDAGVFTMPRNIAPILSKHFDYRRAESTQEIFRAMKDEHPLALIFRERFGDDVEDWAAAADELMYGYLNEGPTFIKKDIENFFADYNIGAAERRELIPFFNLLEQKHRGMYNDLVDLYIGRMNRNNVERVLDNFWLFWPISYQIKATKWMARVMFNRVGGVQTGMAGAYMYEKYRERWERSIEMDSDFKEWLADNSDLLFLVEMMMPMTPESVGVSLNKGARIAGSWLNATLDGPEQLTTAFGDYEYIESVPEAMERVVTFGPIRSYNLWTRIFNSLEVPGFTYGDGEAEVKPPQFSLYGDYPTAPVLSFGGASTPEEPVLDEIEAVQTP